MLLTKKKSREGKTKKEIYSASEAGRHANEHD